MRLTSLKLKNFKAIGASEQGIEFRPITLLFGPNSAGKSTIVQALHYFSEILQRENCDPGTTHIGGKLDLGGFRNLVHMHADESEIELAIKLDIEDTLLPGQDANDELEHLLLGEALKTEAVYDLSATKDIELRLRICWSRVLDTAFVEKYSVFLDGEIFAVINCSEDKKNIFLSHLNYQHHYFNQLILDEPDALSVGAALQEFVEIHSQTEQSPPVTVLPLQLQSGRGAMPVFGKDLPLISQGALLDVDEIDPSRKLTEDERKKEIEDEAERFIERQHFTYLTAYLSRAIVGAGQLANECLKDFLYLGPLRDIPGRHYQPELSPGLERWASGLGAWDQLYRQGETLTDKINDWLADDQRLDAGYEVHYSEYKPLDTSSPLFVALRNGNELLQSDDWIREQLEAMPTQSRVYLKDLRSDVELHPEDLGTGISQVLPVLVAVLGHNKNIVAIEQPELHVHPKFQVELGELFIHAIKHERIAQNTVFILETHSEYIMLRLLRRLYDTANEELEPGAEALYPDDIGVYYVNPADTGVKIAALRLTEEGEFIDRWPNGFFPERKKELF